MTETIKRVTAAVTETFAALDALFQLGVEELHYRPALPDAWTIAEHLEHVSLADHFLLLTITKGCRKAVARGTEAPVPEGESDLEKLDAIAHPGVFEWQVPTHMLPTGNQPLPEIREPLRRQRDACLELLAAMPKGEGRLHTIWLSVHSLGRLDMYQWIYFLVQHARFHLNLIEGRRERREIDAER
jgi:hypothetical protein